MRTARRGLLLVAPALGLVTSAATRPVAGRTVEDVLHAIGPAARDRLRPMFTAAGVPYPPPAVTLLALKQERRLEVWATRGDDAPRRVASYPILAASGGAGPKLREGDRQVPEGVYRLQWLNPASSYHLSMKVDYPNAFDRRWALAEGRTRPGGDIFIHGRDVSIGCLALGDPAIEEMFVLASDVSLPRVKVLIAPVDFRRGRAVAPDPARPAWVDELYRTLRAEMAALAAP